MGNKFDSFYGLRFNIHGNDMTQGFVEWLDGAEVTLMDFAATVADVGFPAAVALVEGRKA